MDELRFEHGWENPAGAEGKELRATWGHLRISVGEWAVSRLYDHDVRSVSDRIYLPLYPVAEWMVENWWSILYEVENKGNQYTTEFAVRHDLNRATAGFALPKLRFGAMGEHVQLHWQRVDMASKHVEFMSYGKQLVDRAQVEQELTRFIAVVIDRLRSEEVHDTPLQRDWEAISKLTDDERTFCKAAAMAGLDPFAITAKDADALITAAERIPPSMVDDMLSIINGKGFANALRELEGLERLAQHADRASQQLLKLRTDLDRGPVQNALPYEIGYAHATRVRATLGLNGDLLSTTDRLMHAVHVGNARSVVDHNFSLTELEGFLGFKGDDCPMFVLGSEQDSPQGRFKFSRCLHEFLFQDTAKPRLVTKADNDAQRINRSFAAELLAPAHALSKDVSGAGWVAWEFVEELSHKYGVSSWLIRHQLVNQNIAKVRDDRDYV